jgi:hypothetical protein
MQQEEKNWRLETEIVHHGSLQVRQRLFLPLVRAAKINTVSQISHKNTRDSYENASLLEDV